MNKQETDNGFKEGTGIKTAVDIVIFDKKGQILLGKRLAAAGLGSWGFPGGHLKTGETIKKCAQREIEEELGSDAEIRITDQVLGVRENSLAPYFSHHLTILIKGSYEGGEIRVNEPEKCEKWEWFDLDNLPRSLFSGIKEILENHKKSEVLVISDWE